MPPPFPEEAAAITGAREKRLQEFSGGRHCARLALGKLGVAPVAIGKADDRSPIWPAGVVGSISHTNRKQAAYCAAAVARSSSHDSLGLDLEAQAVMAPNLYSRIFTATELERASTLDEVQRGSLATLVFSAKESVYKCQYPLSRTFLEFADVEVDELDESRGTFRATLLTEAAPFSRGFVFRGRFVTRASLVVTAVWL